MKLREIMSTPVLTLSPGESASEAFVTMADAGVRHAVVVDTDARVIGVVSDRDLGSRHGASARRGHTVADVMRPHPVVGSPQTTAASAAFLLREHGIGCLPIVDHGALVGIVTRSDLLLVLAGRRRQERRDRATPAPRRPDA